MSFLKEHILGFAPENELKTNPGQTSDSTATENTQNYCLSCGALLSGEDIFCGGCGKKIILADDKSVEAEKNIKQPIISINVSKKQTLIFYDNFLIYKGARINYKDVDGISYLLTRTKHSINFIPSHISSSFQIKLEVNGQKYEIGSSANSFMFFEGKSRKEKEEIFAKLVYILDNLIMPFVRVNLLVKYNKEGELKIGDSLTVNSKGFYKKKFWRDSEFMPWDQYYNSILHQGNLYIYKDGHEKKYKLYFSCSMSTMNAAVFPDLLNILFRGRGVINKKMIKDLEEKSECFK